MDGLSKGLEGSRVSDHHIWRYAGGATAFPDAHEGAGSCGVGIELMGLVGARAKPGLSC